MKLMTESLSSDESTTTHSRAKSTQWVYSKTLPSSLYDKLKEMENTGHPALFMPVHAKLITNILFRAPRYRSDKVGTLCINCILKSKHIACSTQFR
jgi:hypothetical protein